MTEFTKHDYMKSDPLTVMHDQVAEGTESVSLMMENISWNIGHDDAHSMVVISQRFEAIIMTDMGISERVPKQITILIPKNDLYEALTGIMSSADCVLSHDSDSPEGCDSHDG